MPYSAKQIEDLHAGAEAACKEVSVLVERMIVGKWHTLTEARAIEYLRHGVCRRFNVIRHAIERVFTIFPPERTTVLERDELLDVQTYLHALVMNVYGVLDNLAWVFVIERGLENTIGGKKRVGLFIAATQAHLPAPFRALLLSPLISSWYSTYAKNYRDALAHRIPLYVPPFSVADEGQYNALEQEIFKKLVAGDVEQYEALQSQQKALQTICAVFLHSTTDSAGSRPLVLHAQMVADATTVVKIGSELGPVFALPA
jgi:hypothetical protein